MEGLLTKSLALGLLLHSAPTFSDVMIGGYIPSDGWNVTNIATWNQNIATESAFINFFSNFSHRWDWHLKHQANNIANQGAVPLISWMPIDSSRTNTNILGEIAAGNWDTYLNTWAAGLQSWLDSRSEENPRVMIRFGHEFNGTWYSYGDDPARFVTAWQYIHDLFETYGLNQSIEWVWCANNVDVDSINDVTQYYPGNDYVDWTSIDGYNWGSNYSWSQWKTFEDVFANMYLDLTSNYPDKPILLAEVSSANHADLPNIAWGQDGDDSDNGNDTNAWIENMMEELPLHFPAVRAVSIFNVNKELGWAFYGTTNQGVTSIGLSGFNSGINNNPNYFTTDFISTK